MKVHVISNITIIISITTGFKFQTVHCINDVYEQHPPIESGTESIDKVAVESGTVDVRDITRNLRLKGWLSNTRVSQEVFGEFGSYIKSKEFIDQTTHVMLYKIAPVLVGLLVLFVISYLMVAGNFIFRVCGSCDNCNKGTACECCKTCPGRQVAWFYYVCCCCCIEEKDKKEETHKCSKCNSCQTCKADGGKKCTQCQPCIKIYKAGASFLGELFHFTFTIAFIFFVIFMTWYYFTMIAGN